MRRRQIAIIAHRGASAEAPESTAAAIRRAVALRAEMIELDVQLTKDHRLVIFHDERLERTTNGHGNVARWHYRALARLDAGSWFAPRFAGEHILLVSHALRLIPPPCRVNLELKRTRHPTQLIRRVVQCLRWTRTESRVLVSSFDASLLAKLQAVRPQIARALLCRRAPFQALRQATTLGCVALHPHTALVSPALIAKAHAAGCRVHVWTVDRLDEAKRLLRMGVDGVFTNVPGRLRRVARGAPWAEPLPAPPARQAGVAPLTTPRVGRHPAQSEGDPRRAACRNRKGSGHPLAEANAGGPRPEAVAPWRGGRRGDTR